MKKIQQSYKEHFSRRYDGVYVRFLVVPTLIWHRRKRGDIDAYIVSLAVSNGSLAQLGHRLKASSGDWTEIAHSDHNPVNGHDIYDPSDPKQLHVDINHPFQRNQYVEVYTHLSRGSPPKPVGKALNKSKSILKHRSTRFLDDYLL